MFWLSRTSRRTGKRLLTANLTPKLPRLEKPPPATIHWAAPLQCVEIQLIHQPISIKPMTLVLPGSICAPNLNVTWKKMSSKKIATCTWNTAKTFLIRKEESEHERITERLELCRVKICFIHKVVVLLFCGILRVSSAPCKGPISRDYEREFPSVEVGPRLMVRRSKPGHTSLASVRMDSDVSNCGIFFYFFQEFRKEKKLIYTDLPLGTKFNHLVNIHSLASLIGTHAHPCNYPVSHSSR